MDIGEAHVVAAKCVPSEMTELAVCTTKARTLSWSTGETGIGHANSRARMGGVSRIAAEHANARAELRTTKRHHMLAKCSLDIAAIFGFHLKLTARSMPRFHGGCYLHA